MEKSEFQASLGYTIKPLQVAATTKTLFPQFFRVAEKNQKLNPLPRPFKLQSCQCLWGLACACL